MKELELLSPAKNLEYGIQAVKHGADAVYMGASAFGARRKAGNSVSDIESMCRYAHLYRAKVFVTLNTLLYDSELKDAEILIHQLYQAGVDALIIQDLGLLSCDLPPIALHASTQCHITSPEKAVFLEKAGFQRLILARELSLTDIEEIARISKAEIEAFVHGALCVSYSGQCYLSQSLNGRSGNRGECVQACRSTYDLFNQEGTCLKRKMHLLSLGDLNASSYIESMAKAGVKSFKIEGRLKDLYYVKNITAHYRKILDNIMQTACYGKASSGKIDFLFDPDPEKTFHRPYTDFFLAGSRKPMACLQTQKALGKPIAKVKLVHEKYIEVDSEEKISCADGFSYFSSDGSLDGFLVNKVEGCRISPHKICDLREGSILYRNQDKAFEKLLSGESAQRKIAVSVIVSARVDSLRVHYQDEDSIEVSTIYNYQGLSEALQSEKVREQCRRQLSKLGDSPFYLKSFEEEGDFLFFVPASLWNEIRRNLCEQLIRKREEFFSLRPLKEPLTETKPEINKPLDYRANVSNSKAESFYRQCGAWELEKAFELQSNYQGKTLMQCRYCLRFELGQCPKHHSVSPQYLGKLSLRNVDKMYELEFDCAHCIMYVKHA